MLIKFFRKPGGQIDEQVGFSKKVRLIDEQTCNVILDYKERKVLKCVIEGKVTPTTFEKMDEYYREIYPQLVQELVKINTPK
jgi:hypothetical protein